MEYKPSFIDQLDANYISHHGIKGMHWGVRRFQNPDGTLTSSGKTRYKNKRHNSISNKALVAEITAGSLAVAGIAIYAKSKDVDLQLDALTGSPMRNQIAATKKTADNIWRLHSNFSELNRINGVFVDLDDASIRDLETSMRKNETVADNTLHVAKQTFFSVSKSAEIFAKFSKKKAAKLREARENVAKLELATHDLHSFSDFVYSDLNTYRARTKNATNGSRRQTKSRTQATYSTMSVEEASAEIKKARKRAAYEEAHGGLTIETKERLQRAVAAKKAAMQRE